MQVAFQKYYLSDRWEKIKVFLRKNTINVFFFENLGIRIQNPPPSRMLWNYSEVIKWNRYIRRILFLKNSYPIGAEL